jgi:hypothetical protein
MLTDEWINECTENMKDTLKQSKKTMVVCNPEIDSVLKSWSSQRLRFTENFDLDSGKIHRKLVVPLLTGVSFDYDDSCQQGPDA